MTLATIESDGAGTMSVGLVPTPDGLAVMLIGRNEDGSIEELIEEGKPYQSGASGIVDACETILGMYSAQTWGLTMLVDWRDYLPE
jgi:hypothetical protein